MAKLDLSSRMEETSIRSTREPKAAIEIWRGRFLSIPWTPSVSTLSAASGHAHQSRAGWVFLAEDAQQVLLGLDHGHRPGLPRLGGDLLDRVTARHTRLPDEAAGRDPPRLVALRADDVAQGQLLFAEAGRRRFDRVRNFLHVALHAQ